jgi:5'-nucleotidase
MNWGNCKKCFIDCGNLFKQSSENYLMPHPLSLKTRVLVTNDDGIDAPGLEVLERIARTLSNDVWVIAPETQQSGAAHSVSLHKPLRFSKLAERRYAVAGTPTDCVITAVRAIMPEPIDLVLSGINRGPNVADDVTHSGTVAAAMEGSLCNIPSIAFSQGFDFDAKNPTVHWATAQAYAARIIVKLLAEQWDQDTFFNVNFPDVPPEDVKGIKCVAQGKHRLYKQLIRADHSEAQPSYWVHWEDAGADPRRPDVDIHWLAEGYVTVTPICLDLTNYAMLGRLKYLVET